MRRLVFLVVGVGEEYRGELVEGDLAVGLRVRDWLAFRRGLKRGEIGLAVTERAEQREADRVRPHVEAAEPDAEKRAKLRPQGFGVAHALQVAADGRGAPHLL